MRFHRNRPLIICTLPITGAFSILMRAIGLASKAVYWSVDWYPSSKSSYDGSTPRLIMSTFMQGLDKFCFEHADVEWDLTEGISDARRRRWGTTLAPRRQSVMFPLARSFNQSQRPSSLPYKVVFIGRDYYFTEGGELWTALSAMKALRDEGLDVSLEVFTGMDQLTAKQSKFLEFAKSIGAESIMAIHQRMDYDKVSEAITSCICGLALFSSSRISNFAFSGKVMNYLENGIPVIITENSAISSLIKENQAGVVIGKVDALQVSTAIKEIIEKQAAFKKGVRNVVEKYMNGDNLLAELKSL